MDQQGGTSLEPFLEPLPFVSVRSWLYHNMFRGPFFLASERWGHFSKTTKWGQSGKNGSWSFFPLRPRASGKKKLRYELLQVLAGSLRGSVTRKLDFVCFPDMGERGRNSAAKQLNICENKSIYLQYLGFIKVSL